LLLLLLLFLFLLVWLLLFLFLLLLYIVVINLSTYLSDSTATRGDPAAQHRPGPDGALQPLPPAPSVPRA
jgi:hypothetical protein